MRRRFGTLAGTRQIITQSRSHVVALRRRRPAPLAGSVHHLLRPEHRDSRGVRGPGHLPGIDQPLTAVRVSGATANGRRARSGVPSRCRWHELRRPLGRLPVWPHASQQGTILLCRAETGKVLWTTRGREAENAALIASGDLLIATTTEGELVVAHRDPAKFASSSATPWLSRQSGHPALAGRGLLIKDAEKLAYWVFRRFATSVEAICMKKSWEPALWPWRLPPRCPPRTGRNGAVRRRTASARNGAAAQVEHDGEHRLEARDAGPERIDADHLGRDDLPQHRHGRPQRRPRALGAGSGGWPDPLEEAHRGRQSHRAQAEHVFVVAGDRRPDRVGDDRRRHPEGVRPQRQRAVDAGHPEGLRRSG